MTKPVRKRRYLQLLLALLSTILTCLALEGVLRIHAARTLHHEQKAWRDRGEVKIPANRKTTLRHLIRKSNNPHILYELRPDLDVRFMGGRVTTNPDGFRGTGVAAVKPADEIRVVGLGDSCMFGWGVHDEETYLAILERERNGEQGEKRWRTINLAAPGYNTAVEVEMLKHRGLAYRPDIVIVHFVRNDTGLPNYMLAEDDRIRLTKSYLVEAVSRILGGRFRMQSEDRLVRTRRKIPERYRYMTGETAVDAGFRELKRLAEEHGFKPLILTHWSPPDYLRKTADELGIPIVNGGDAVSEYMRAHGIEHYGGSELTLSRRDPHHSAIGHQVMAEALLRYLRAVDRQAE